MSDLITAFSSQSEPKNAVKEIRQAFGQLKPSLVIFFASSAYDLDRLGKAFKAAFSPATVMGCSTAGEIISGKMLKNSVVAMGLNKNIVPQVCLSVLENIRQGADFDKAFQSFAEAFGKPANQLDPAHYAGLILADGLSVAEEKIINKIGNLTNIPFIGGSAGDDLKFKTTYVYGDNKAYTNAAVLVIFKAAVPFEILKTQSFTDLKKKLVATQVDEPSRQVLEFNHQPAAKAYSAALGIKEADLANHFMSNPLGLMIQGEPYVRSPQQVKDGHVVFYCSVLKNMEYTLLQSTDIVKDTERALKDKIKQMGHVSGIINFHCILRTLELEAKKQTDAYGAIFKDIPTIGFSTYGELYLGHINQTSTMLLLK